MCNEWVIGVCVTLFAWESLHIFIYMVLSIFVSHLLLSLQWGLAARQLAQYSWANPPMNISIGSIKSPNGSRTLAMQGESYETWAIYLIMTASHATNLIWCIHCGVSIHICIHQRSVSLYICYLWYIISQSVSWWCVQQSVRTYHK